MRVITREEVDKPFLAPLGEVIYELFGAVPETGSTRNHSLAHVVVPPGKLSPKHYHKIFEESYYILKGQARVTVDGQDYILAPGQACLIMPGDVHQLFNDHDTETLELLVVCAPAWSEGDYYVIED